MKETAKLRSKEAAAWLWERDDFLILTHRRPDGDTLGSAAGLCQALWELGKDAYVLENPETTARYQAMIAPYIAPSDFLPQVVLTVDTADAEILQKNAGPYLDRIDLAIDHHGSHRNYAAHLCLNADRASCGEVVYDILRALGSEISAEVATPLYVALSTDTGCFVYANTTANTLETAGALIRAGADYRRVNKQLFRTKSRARIALDGVMFSSLRYYGGDEIAVLILTLATMEQCGVTEDDLDDVATIPNMVEGVRIGIVVRELPTGGSKVSVRTAPTADANAICQAFGGGGHPMAAGCVVDASPEETAAKLVAVAEAAL